MRETVDVTKIFGSRVFNDAMMKQYLPKKVYDDLERTIQEGSELSSATAEVVANAMKDWAVEHGATHYTHWFQPLTGVTAEKHDSFIGMPNPEGKTLMEFSGKELIKGEPDASSFPSGGLRATFEARGYTAWDCTSPAFLKEDAAGVILCIPTAFCSYTGEALDKKTPLLRSMGAVNTQTMRLLRALGNRTSKKVMASVGAEQEYFLIDREKFLKRKDLVYTGRTLFGSMPAKGQELEDHYFGSIRERIGAYMKDVNEELWKLGVPAKTQHNEVAPAQHELAPIFSMVNVATDQNQMVMETLKKVATRQGLACLLHEKPFSGVNGSGKHNNWSLTTDDGMNLLDPGKTPHENVQFLLILMCILRAVDKHASLLRVSAACVGNDHRLGKQEAPPAIISVFLGEQLQDVLTQLIETGEATHSKKGERLITGVAYLPRFSKDATDRNRTSPFAFTGNKFEFRMVGSSDSIGCANTVLNSIAAEAFLEAAERIEAAEDKLTAVHDMIKEYAMEHQRVVFNGNGYSQEWVEEAERRGLPNIAGMVDAIPALLEDDAVAMFEKLGVFTRTELEARAEINYESYIKQINIEAKAMVNMANKQIIPAVIGFNTKLAESLGKVSAACPEADVSVQKELLLECSALLSEAKVAAAALEEADAEASCETDVAKAAGLFYRQVLPAMEALRAPVDALEHIVEKKMWPFPSYGDMLFEV